MDLLVIVFFIASIWLIRKLAWNIEEGTIEQRERNPELNTKPSICMKEDFKNFQSQNTKTVCFISVLMVLATITQLLEGKFFANGRNISMGYCCFNWNIYCHFLGLV